MSSLYHALSTRLNTPSSKPLEVDVLPSAYPLPAPSPDPPILYEEGDADRSLAIRKKDLVQAFVQARRVLFTPQSLRTGNGNGESTAEESASRKQDDEVYKATSVILLFDPEHITAANYRKRFLLARSLPSASGSTGVFSLEAAIKGELSLLNTLLTSHLKRHTKSPTLWSHRLWLLRTFLVADATPIQERRGLLEQELEVILRSADQHFANYYAFMHGRHLVSLFTGSKGEIGRRPMPNSIVDQQILDRMKDWCFSHPRDISGWGFLVFLLERSELGKELIQKLKVEITTFAEHTGHTGESVRWINRSLEEYEAHIIVT